MPHAYAPKVFAFLSEPACAFVESHLAYAFFCMRTSVFFGILLVALCENGWPMLVLSLKSLVELLILRRFTLSLLAALLEGLRAEQY